MEWSRAGGARTLYNAPSLLGGLSAAWTGDLPRFVLYATPPAFDVRSLALEQAGLRLAGSSTPFLHSAPAYPFTPSFSPDGRHISYTGKISDDHDEICMADEDGTNHRQLTHDGYRDISFNSGRRMESRSYSIRSSLDPERSTSWIWRFPAARACGSSPTPTSWDLGSLRFR
jgi:hypothetical protein